MTNPKLMKVSDEEREKALQTLSKAVAAGRISYEDFEARVDRALAAKNYIELGDVVVDLPVRAPRPPSEPHRYDYLPGNASPRALRGDTEVSGFELDQQPWPSRSAVVAMMSVRAAVGVVAAAIVDVKLLGEVLPSASLIGGAGVILLVVLATVLAAYNAVACTAAIPPKRVRSSEQPPEIAP